MIFDLLRATILCFVNKQNTHKKNRRETFEETTGTVFLILILVDLNRENTLLMTGPQLKHLTDVLVEKNCFLLAKDLKNKTDSNKKRCLIWEPRHTQEHQLWTSIQGRRTARKVQWERPVWNAALVLW